MPYPRYGQIITRKDLYDRSGELLLNRQDKSFTAVININKPLYPMAHEMPAFSNFRRPGIHLQQIGSSKIWLSCTLSDNPGEAKKRFDTFKGLVKALNHYGYCTNRIMDLFIAQSSKFFFQNVPHESNNHGFSHGHYHYSLK